ncbi:helix-turn-helix domain-containing protein [Allosalinactinospora lopnorensis]|uniref:helix-turn-helix domain-containing protein n=1 Tax=Allosalinactinospora lopnorensis TaxID=1352348 RepID=UPI000623C36B|nr:helix-turn-helix domain-containing protein [Allosalinactinospora lopnorensis]
MSGQVRQAYRFALDLSPRQERDLARHAGAARVAYNWGLARIKANLSQREAERSYGIGDQELTPSVNWSLYGLRRAWNQAKNEVAPWCTECGVILDRDLNAARNLAALVERHVAGSGSETENGRGADRETGLVPAGGCEASTPRRALPRGRRGLSPGNG